MKQNKTSPNKKALPKFLLILLSGSLIGGVIGFITGFMGRTSTLSTAIETLRQSFFFLSPYFIWISTLLFGTAGFFLYRKASFLYKNWDGESEEDLDLIRKMNPEKKASVYDMKFQKKWLECCDENELRKIGQASYKAYVASTTTCIILLACLIFLANICSIGIIPVLLVSLIWLVNTVVYSVESIRLERHD